MRNAVRSCAWYTVVRYKRGIPCGTGVIDRIESKPVLILLAAVTESLAAICVIADIIGIIMVLSRCSASAPNQSVLA